MLETIRGLVRPTITWVLMGSAVVMAFLQQLGYGAVPEWYIALLVQIGTFWFLGKEIQKILNSR